MKSIMTPEQKDQIKRLRKALALERKYTPRGQGDSVNQHLAITNILWEINRTKQDPEYRSYRR